MSGIRLHDTRTGESLPLRVGDPERGAIRIYACGPTVYSRIHIGNARPYVIFSLLKRFLEHEGLKTTLVVNVTDVNDKIYDAARRADPAHPRSERRAGGGDDRALQSGHRRAGVGTPRSRAAGLGAETMGAIIDYIGTLVDSRARLCGGWAMSTSGCARTLDTGVFRTVGSRTWIRGRRSRALRAQGGSAGFRVVEGTQGGGGHVWDSPWGPGRPGWHIECSAMAEDCARRRLRHPRRRF